MAATMPSVRAATIAVRADRVPPSRPMRRLVTMIALIAFAAAMLLSRGLAGVAALIAAAMFLVVVVTALGPNTARTGWEACSR